MLLLFLFLFVYVYILFRKCQTEEDVYGITILLKPRNVIKAKLAQK